MDPRHTRTPLALLLGLGLRAMAPESTSLEGLIVDREGRALPQVLVSVRGTGLPQALEATSDAEGRFRLLVPKGRYRVHFAREGYIERQRGLEVLNPERPLHLKVGLDPIAGATTEVVASRGFVRFTDLDTGGLDLAGVAVSASQGVVTESRLEGRPILRAGEALETVPGIIVTQHSGGGKANQFFCRGFNLDHGTDFATTLVGVPINLPTHAHGQGYLDLNFLIPELISGIQYWKGSYLAEQGDFSNAGSANINYFNRLDRSLLRLETGSFGYRRGLLAASTGLGKGDLLGAMEGYHYDAAWDRPDHYRRANGFLRYSQGDTDNALVLSAFGYAGRWNSNHQVPQRAIDAGLIGRFGNLDATDGGRTDRTALALDWRRTWEGHQTRLQAYVCKYDMSLWSNFTFFLEHPEQGDQTEQTDHRWTTGFHLSDLWSQGPFEHTVGLQVRQDRISQVALFPTQGQVRWAKALSDDAVRQSQVALYAQTTFRWRDHFRAVAGLRADRYDFDVRGRGPAPEGIEPSLLQGTRGAHLLSPKLNLAFGPWGSTECYASWAEGFHSNDARGVVKRMDLEGTAITTATPLVKSRAAELGVRSHPVEGWSTAFNIWRLDMDSELVFDGESGTTQPSSPSRRVGMEWSNDVSPAPWLNVDFDFAFSRARFKGLPSGQDRIPEAIEGTGSLGLALRLRENLSFNLRLRYFGPRPLVEDNTVRSHASTLAQVRLGWQVTPRLSVDLEVMNLLDAKVNDIEYWYATRLKGEPEGGITDRLVHPTDPRSLRLGVGWTF